VRGTWIAFRDHVLIARCAWHRRYYGHSKLLGISQWRGLRLDFTEGICPKCAARVRVVRQRPAAGPAQRGAGRTPEVVVVALAVLTGLVLIARLANQGSAPVQVGDLGPGTATAVQTTPAPAIEAAPARPRRPRAAPTAIVRPASPAERLQSP
jgi:hypothetical protein